MKSKKNISMIIFCIIILYALYVIIDNYYNEFESCVKLISKDDKDYLSLLLSMMSLPFLVQTFFIPFAKENIYDTESYIKFCKRHSKNRYKQLKFINILCFVFELLLLVSLILYFIDNISNIELFKIFFIYFNVLNFIFMLILILLFMIIINDVLQEKNNVN